MKIDVSIVIVCMNNLRNLYPCLNSIKLYTKLSYEVLVVAYLFSPENLAKIKKDFSWIKIIVSNEIRGFSENNNLALRQAKGKYCFVVNDDTEMKMPVIDELVKTIETLPENVAVVSPVTKYPNGNVQFCGRPYKNWQTIIKQDLHLFNEKKDHVYSNKKGVFKSYNIIGAAFLIKTETFRNVGWFDEYYFFSPEDIALSTKLNKMGYSCYVNADVFLIHYEGMTGKSLSMIQTATRPAMVKGSLHFYSEGKKVLYAVLGIWIWMHSFFQFVYHGMQGFFKKKPNASYILSIGDWRVCCTLFSKKTPKQIFEKYYNMLGV